MPKTTAKKIIGSTSPFAIDSNGLVGIILSSVCISVGAPDSFPLIAASPTTLKPKPGLKIFAKSNPIITATALVKR